MRNYSEIIIDINLDSICTQNYKVTHGKNNKVDRLSSEQKGTIISIIYGWPNAMR